MACQRGRRTAGRGGSPFLGYYRREGSVESKLQDGWFQTGDAVTKTERGELVFLERLSDLKRLRSGESFPPQFVETRLRFSPFIKDIMTVGDETLDFVAALINIDFDVVSRWAEDKRVGTTFTDLSQKPEVASCCVPRYNGSTASADARAGRPLRHFPKELDPDEGELTRSHRSCGGARSAGALPRAHRRPVRRLERGADRHRDLPGRPQEPVSCQVRLRDVFGKADASRGAAEGDACMNNLNGFAAFAGGRNSPRSVR